MADGGLTLQIDEALAERLRAAASAEGLSPEKLAISLLDQAIEGDWTDALGALSEYDLTGEYVPLSEATAEFHDALEKRLAEKG